MAREVDNGSSTAAEVPTGSKPPPDDRAASVHNPRFSTPQGDLAMKKLAKISAIRQLANDTKGATMVEYALMLFLILVVAAVAVKALGKTVSTSTTAASAAFGG
jgi:Flp pilus assembly pilin Flp